MKHLPFSKALLVAFWTAKYLSGMCCNEVAAQKKATAPQLPVKKVQNTVVVTPPKVEHFRLAKGKTIRIVLDPGHGGHDPGTLRSHKHFAHEKDIVLDITQLVAKYIEENLENIELIHTRQADNFVSLKERADLANSAEADFFISIHCNASPRSWVSGTQVHIHDHAFVHSLALAQSIDEEFRTRARRPSRGIFNTKDRRHSLYVLQYTTMPSVLIEVGFLSNKEEEKYLNGQYGKEIIASAIYRGLRNYLVATGVGVRFKTGSQAAKKQLREEKADSEKIRYRVQITASETRIPLTHYDFRKLKMPVHEHVFEGETFRYRYTAGGSFDDIKKATEVMREVRQKGFPDAYLIIDPQQRAQASKK
ncbi:MAG: N-acetylmuramoyl-L-alanine amidase [Cytophagales bacterium]|nr:N-acetylmuramoyl-L-alanine amidase [Bernardetiaceae bacterium]MDW8203659.1 N-acetylmuramoyl-L-alanine amidase [Cytophagales bacterium]